MRIASTRAFDCFDERGHTLNAAGVHLERRLTLKRVMDSMGWEDYRREWWHFEQKNPDARVRDVPYGAAEPDEE